MLERLRLELQEAKAAIDRLGPLPVVNFMHENFERLLDDSQRFFAVFMEISKNYVELARSKGAQTDREGLYAKLKMLADRHREAEAASRAKLQAIMKRVFD